MDYVKIGNNLKAIMKARGYTQKRVAELAGSNPSTVGLHISTGRMELGSLIKYAEVLGCGVEDILSDALDVTAFALEDKLSEKWPWNIAAAVWGDTSQMRLYGVYVPGLLESVQGLSEREQKILSLRYYNGLTLEKTGVQLGVTRERIREMEARALRKLAHPRLQAKWRMDDRLMKKAFDVMEEASEIRLAAIMAIDKSKAALAALDSIHEIAGAAMLSPKEGAKKANDISGAKKANDISGAKIEVLNFSNRTYNCLKRAGIDTVGDLIGTPKEKLMSIRNLGRKSYEEVLKRLDEIEENGNVV